MTETTPRALAATRTPVAVATVTGLFVYPIKSCGGTALAEARLDDRGIVGDRAFMLVDDSGRFLTQRELPRMALVAPHLTERDGRPHLAVSAPGQPDLDLTPTDAGPRRSVVVWRSVCAAVDQGDAAAEWFSAAVGAPVRLVRMADEERRAVNPDFAVAAAGAANTVGFADGYPLLLISEASLADLNSRLATPLPMNRFRPNIVISGCAAFAEDTWPRLRLGSIEFAGVKPCARCQITTIDQATARVHPREPLATLARYRRIDGDAMFGQNLIHLSRGVLRLGDPLTPLA